MKITKFLYKLQLLFHLYHFSILNNWYSLRANGYNPSYYQKQTSDVILILLKCIDYTLRCIYHKDVSEIN